MTGALKKAPRKPKAAPARPAATRDSGRTRADIVSVALRLFARRGVGAVSLREIVHKSKQGNQSAIHYHFRDKRGLVLAVTRHVHLLFQPYLEETLASIEATEKSGAASDEELVAALVIPMIRVYHSGERGRDAVRFLMRLAADGGDAGQALVLRQSAPYLRAIEARLTQRLPHKAGEKLWMQIMLCGSCTLFALATLGGLKFSPFGNRQPLYRGRREDSVQDFVQFVSRGVLG